MAMIQIKNLYVNKGNETVLEDFSRNVDTGEVVSIVGETGVGKTTLLRTIAGLDGYKGDVSVDGEISFMFQEPRLLPWANIRKNILLPIRLQGIEIDDEVNERMYELAEALDVEDHLEKEVSEVSGGQKQRLLKIRALITDPDVLLLDEPFKSLDQKTRKESIRKVLELCRERNITVVVATHQKDVYSESDRTINLEE